MSDIQNSYFNNRKDWNAIYDKEKANASMWRMFGFISMLISLFAIGGMIYVAQLPSIVPFIFKEDASGGITALGIPNSEFKVDNRIVANQLAVFVEALRQVPNSDEMKRKYVRQVKMMSTSSLFYNTLAPMLKDTYAVIGQSSLHIVITTILPIEKNIWQIDWIEYKNGIQVGKFKATINYIRTPMQLKEPTELIWNPLGMIIKEVNINQVIGS